ncbi:MAG: sulfur carrier protein ThiS [Gammaproteobacteria bacterium]|nr:MAG: sulfur carrier protein ThiS [Gammaproteobacteria bacterium]
MTIDLNGEQRQLLASATVADLLAQLELAGRRVAVEVNLEIVPRSVYSNHVLNTGDRVEVVQAIGGG